MSASSADISACGRYRYTLTEPKPPEEPPPPLVCRFVDDGTDEDTPLGGR